MSEKYNTVMFNTVDPTNPLAIPSGTPALTTLLYKVCDGDTAKFDEACRIIYLFLDKKAELDDTNMEPVKKLALLMGYVQNGTDGIITLYQDDADMDYCVSHRAACSENPSWTVFDKTLMGAINKAYGQHKDDCE